MSRHGSEGLEHQDAGLISWASLYIRHSAQYAYGSPQVKDALDTWALAYCLNFRRPFCFQYSARLFTVPVTSLNLILNKISGCGHCSELANSQEPTATEATKVAERSDGEFMVY